MNEEPLKYCVFAIQKMNKQRIYTQNDVDGAAFNVQIAIANIN